LKGTSLVVLLTHVLEVVVDLIDSSASHVSSRADREEHTTDEESTVGDGATEGISNEAVVVGLNTETTGDGTLSRVGVVESVVEEVRATIGLGELLLSRISKDGAEDVVESLLLLGVLDGVVSSLDFLIKSGISSNEINLTISNGLVVGNEGVEDTSLIGVEVVVRVVEVNLRIVDGKGSDTRAETLGHRQESLNSLLSEVESDSLREHLEENARQERV